MKHLIKKLLREGLLLTENSLYNDKIIDGVTKKIGDSSDDTLNKVAIAGLFKNSFGNIQQIKSKDQLDTLFKSWYDSTINKMIKTTAFIDNKDLAKKFLDAYVKNIKSLGDKARPFPTNKTMNDKIEKSLVDLVNNNKWIKDTSIKQSNDMYNPKDEDIVHEDDDIIILDTNTKAKCVRYGQGESWCISKPELNYYNTYRIKYGATPYFVLQKNVEGDEHKLVIMHYPDGYAIADRSNTGDRVGGNQYDTKPWAYIVSQIPNLKGLEKFFPYREITEGEKRYEDIIKWAKGYDDDNLQGYIDQEIKGLIINGSQVEAKDFIRDYSAEDIKISNENIKSLRPEVLDSLIESGYFLAKGKEQTNLLSTKQQLRVIRMKIKNLEGVDYYGSTRIFTLTGDEVLLLPKDEQNEYVNSLDYKNLEKSLNTRNIADKLANTNEPKKLMTVLGDVGDFLLNKSILNVDSVKKRRLFYPLIINSKNPEEIMSIVGDTFFEEVKKEFTIDGPIAISSFLRQITNILTKGKEPEKIINILSDTGGGYTGRLQKGKDIIKKYGKLILTNVENYVENSFANGSEKEKQEKRIVIQKAKEILKKYKQDI